MSNLAVVLARHICGHSTPVTYNPARSTAAEVLHRCRTRRCKECGRKHHDKKDAAKIRLATQAEQEQLLPELKGTEKQVAWARKIRWSLLYAIPDWVKEIQEWAQEAAQDTHLGMMGVTSAKWWIDHRSHQGKHLAFAGLARRLWGEDFAKNPIPEPMYAEMVEDLDLDDHGRLKGVHLEDHIRSTRGEAHYKMMCLWLQFPTQDSLWIRRREEIWQHYLQKPPTWWWQWNFISGREYLHMAITELYGADAWMQEPINHIYDEE